MLRITASVSKEFEGIDFRNVELNMFSFMCTSLTIIQLSVIILSLQESGAILELN